MLNNLKMAALAAAVTLTGSVFSAPSFAQDVEFLIGPDGVRVRAAEYCDSRRGRSDDRCRDYRDRDDEDYRRDDRRGDDRYGRRRCGPDEAVSIARSDYGVRRARVADVGRRTIKVSGWGERGPVLYTFARDRECTLIDRQRLRRDY